MLGKKKPPYRIAKEQVGAIPRMKSILGRWLEPLCLGKKSHPVRMAKKGGRDTPDEIDPGQVARTFVFGKKKPPL